MCKGSCSPGKSTTLSGKSGIRSGRMGGCGDDSKSGAWVVMGKRGIANLKIGRFRGWEYNTVSKSACPNRGLLEELDKRQEENQRTLRCGEPLLLQAVGGAPASRLLDPRR